MSQVIVPWFLLCDTIYINHAKLLGILRGILVFLRTFFSHVSVMLYSISSVVFFSDVFSTPLEEFERALIKAERAKSMDEEDWLPALESFEDETPLSEYNAPAINYVQTRKPRHNLL